MYQVFDPVTNGLHVSCDVVFEEKRTWDWNTQTSAGQIDLETFMAEFQSTVASTIMEISADSETGSGSIQT